MEILKSGQRLSKWFPRLRSGLDSQQTSPWRTVGL